MNETEDPIPALKEQLRRTILDELENRNPIVLARTLRIDESRMSDLQHNRIERFSIARLIRLLARINRAVEMTVVPTGLIPYPRSGLARAKPWPTSLEWERHGIACWGRGGPPEYALARFGKRDHELASSGKSISGEHIAHSPPDKELAREHCVARTFGLTHISPAVQNPEWSYEVEISFE